MLFSKVLLFFCKRFDEFLVDFLNFDEEAEWPWQNGLLAASRQAGDNGSHEKLTQLVLKSVLLRVLENYQRRVK